MCVCVFEGDWSALCVVLNCTWFVYVRFVFCMIACMVSIITGLALHGCKILAVGVFCVRHGVLRLCIW